MTTITVLHVDDNKGILNLTSDYLEDALEEPDLEVRTVQRPEVALDVLAEEPINCVVSDYKMDEMNGLELFEAVRERYPTLPFILFTGEGSEKIASEAISAGVTDYLRKRTGTEQYELLANRIENAVASYRGRKALNRLERAEQALEHAADAILITSTDGTIRYVNPAFERVTGYSTEEVLGRTPDILNSGEQSDQYYERLWDTILSGETWEEEIINERKDGEHYCAHQTIAPITDDGEVKEFVSIQRDVTERSQLEIQLERTATALTRLYDVTTDQDHSLGERIDRTLEIGAEYFGYSIGYLTRIDEGTQEIRAATGDHDLIQQGETDPLERTYCRKTVEADGPVVFRDAPEEGWEDDPAYQRFGLRCYLGAKVMVDGEVWGTLCFADTESRDDPILESQRSAVKVLAQWIGYELERERAQQNLQRENSRLEEFASIVSHDLQNPLQVAKGRVSMLEDDHSGETDTIESIERSLDRMEAIIEDTLTLASQGKIVEEVSDVEIQSVAAESWETVESGNATLNVRTDLTIRADDERLRHVFENLFRNAVEHGSGSVRIEVGGLEDGGGFYVADDGPGIPADERESVFEAGYSTDGGTGMGLTIIKRITDAHGWDVSVRESDAGGTRFEIRGVSAEHPQPVGVSEPASPSM
ncbi:histidine kinase [Halorubrum salipaludis]|uniref:histidine kinase n=1 Tax=Halorubrum salipaludis TaxID=2032630 RepID=A0A2A2FH05_9EURY|nr:histidine kinase [Halorubrum salipaludis]